MRSKSRSNRIQSIFVVTILTGWIVFIVGFPIYWLVITSFKLPLDVSQGPKYLPWIDFNPVLDAWKSLLGGEATFNTSKYFINSIVISSISALITVLIGSLAGYGLARFEYQFGSWRNKDIAFWFISLRMMPPAAAVVAFLIMYNSLHVLDTVGGLIVAYVSFNLPFVIWVTRNFFADLPVDLEECAMVDGCSRLGAFFRIALPLALPGLAAAFVFSFVFSANEYLFALILTFQRASTVPLLIAGQVTSQGIVWNRLSAVTLLQIIPSFITIIGLERYFIKGLVAGAIK